MRLNAAKADIVYYARLGKAASLSTYEMSNKVLEEGYHM
jgi:hypothetical protein